MSIINTIGNLNGDSFMEDYQPKITKRRDFKAISNITNKRNSFNIAAFNKRKNQIVIPFDETFQKYFVNPEIIDFLDSKQYLINTIQKFNSAFNLDNSIIPIPMLILIITFYTIILSLFCYTSMLGILISLFNPLIVLLMLAVIIMIIKYFIGNYYSVKSFYRRRIIKRIIGSENEVCEIPNVKWAYGKEGAWIEFISEEAKETITE